MRGLVWSLLLGVEQEAKKHVGVYEVPVFISLISNDCQYAVCMIITHVYFSIYTELQANPSLLPSD